MFMIVALDAGGTRLGAQLPAKLSQAGATTTPKRPLTAEDILNFESFAGASFSPDGELLAYLKRASEREGISPNHDFLRDRQRTELWVVSVKGGEPRKIQT